jgi:dipeptidase D
VIEFMKTFGAELKLETIVDEVGNVIIRKPASAGMEDRVPIVLQSHLDMVHQKNAGTEFDFDKQGIDMYVEGDWVKARGTTLGADNGIGVAIIMSLLASKEIAHPAIEALFTIDEETGMTGALALKGGILKGEMMLNLDTEEDNELTIGCAGGADLTCTGTYKQVKPGGNAAFKVTINGLTGGHSGTDIHKGRGNANKLMNRLLLELTKEFSVSIASIDGGSLRNAIPRESVAVIVAANENAANVKKKVADYSAIVKAEYSTTDSSIAVTIDEASVPEQAMDMEVQQKLLRSIYSCPNGIYRMSSDIEGLVQTSNNIARVIVKEGSYSVQCLSRSSVDTEKADLLNAIGSAFELAEAEVTIGGAYPGWKPRPEAPIVQVMTDVYKELFKEAPHVSAVHAGLECGILGKNYPDMQMISFGPNIYGAHSPDEKVQISSVQKFWSFLLETLKKIPAKN